MKVRLRLIACMLLLLAAGAGAQTPPRPAGSDEAALRGELAELRAQVEALTRRVQALTASLAELSSRAVLDQPIQAVTDYFAGAESGMTPQVLANYPGRLVSATITLLRTERYGGQENYSNGRSVVVTPGGSAAIPVEGAGAPCTWVVYDERNALKLRSENCSYLSPGLRGYFTGVAYYRR
jgi:hypothetical protein